MALLLDKTLLTNQKVFQFLTDDLKIQAPKVLYCYFEAAILGATQKVLNCQLRCCDLHWKHPLTDHISSCGLKSHYQWVSRR